MSLSNTGSTSEVGTVATEPYRLLTAKEAAQYMRVSLLTLSKIEKQGGLVPYRTPGGHRRYSMEMLNEYLENSRTIRRPNKPKSPSQR